MIHVHCYIGDYFANAGFARERKTVAFGDDVSLFFFKGRGKLYDKFEEGSLNFFSCMGTSTYVWLSEYSPSIRKDLYNMYFIR